MRRNERHIKRQLKAPLQVYEKRLEMIEDLLAELHELSGEGSIIVVEGKRDVIALKKLGLHGDFRLATHHPLVNFCENISRSGRKIVILTDWDRRGNILASKLVENLHSLGVSPETRVRQLIISLVQKEIKDVESLPSYVKKLKQTTKGRNVTDKF